MSEWQPIDTAPRDGSRMLLWMHLEKGRVVYVGGYDPHWTGQCWVSENARIPSSMTPAGWMLLPDPPAQENRIITGAKEALAHAKGEPTGAVEHTRAARQGGEQ